MTAPTITQQPPHTTPLDSTAVERHQVETEVRLETVPSNLDRALKLLKDPQQAYQAAPFALVHRPDLQAEARLLGLAARPALEDARRSPETNKPPTWVGGSKVIDLVELLIEYSNPLVRWRVGWEPLADPTDSPTALSGRGSVGQTTRRTQAQRRLAAEEVATLVGEYEAGAGVKALAQRWGVHRATVASHLRAAGVTLRRQGLPDDMLEEATKLYRQGWSLQRLGERYGCDAKAVHSAFKRHAIPRRAPWERPH